MIHRLRSHLWPQQTKNHFAALRSSLKVCTLLRAATKYISVIVPRFRHLNSGRRSNRCCGVRRLTAARLSCANRPPPRLCAWAPPSLCLSTFENVANYQSGRISRSILYASYLMKIEYVSKLFQPLANRHFSNPFLCSNLRAPDLRPENAQAPFWERLSHRYPSLRIQGRQQYG